MDIKLYTLSKEQVDKIEDGELKSFVGEVIPTFESIKGLTYFKIKNIMNNLRTRCEIEDLFQEAYFSYTYTVNRSLSNPIRDFKSYYTMAISNTLLRYIYKNGLLIKQPYLSKKFDIYSIEGDEGAYYGEDSFKKKGYKESLFNLMDFEENLEDRIEVEKCFKYLSYEESLFMLKYVTTKKKTDLSKELNLNRKVVDRKYKDIKIRLNILCR